ncbi:MAG: hypothetical protein A3K19_08275 [Lentisphaerae bacterium RIFOXYB12_FULL_65_16]|nr:MAG: hypothetical protein A3K18_00275 [Lentisphaerae bacterium RIFOXYA12_64_32]OGV89865.1 MAG: hypothetical protein A3K19_08275 [Lentisphaerae bacterium RIFOXYB12_FULL_65_16]
MAEERPHPDFSDVRAGRGVDLPHDLTPLGGVEPIAIDDQVVGIGQRLGIDPEGPGRVRWTLCLSVLDGTNVWADMRTPL